MTALFETDGEVGDRNPERGDDCAFDQLDIAAMGAGQFRGNGKAEACARPGRALERLEQMRAGFSAMPGPVSDTSITTTAPSRRPVIRI